jgi:hypothetical protein
MVTSTGRVQQRVTRIRAHRASASVVRSFVRSTPRTTIAESQHLRAFELMRHDHVAAQSAREGRANAAQRRNDR